MAEQAALYAAAVAAKPGLSSAAFHNCIAAPLVKGSNMLQLLSGVPLHCSLGVGLILVNKVEELCKSADQTVMLETAEHSTDPAVKKAFEDKFNAEIAVGEAKTALEECSGEVAQFEGEMEFAKAMEPGVEKHRGKAKRVGDEWRAK